MDICGGIQLLNHSYLRVLGTEGFHVWSPDATMSQVSHKAGFMSGSPKRITQIQAYRWITRLVKSLQRKGSRGWRGGMSFPRPGSSWVLQPCFCFVLFPPTLVSVSPRGFAFWWPFSKIRLYLLLTDSKAKFILLGRLIRTNI